MEFNDYQPIYQQIMDYIKAKIISGTYPSGERIPSVRDIALELKVNPNTVQRAYQELDREGLTFSRRGLGSFVIEDKDTITNLRKNIGQRLTTEYISEMKKMNYTSHEVIAMIEGGWSYDTTNQ